MEFALDGLRMVDFTRYMAGPVCTMLLADMGMEVIKVESARQHDQQRSYQPFLPDSMDLDSTGHYGDSSGHFVIFNRGKKSITLNVSTPKGLELAKKLVAISDVIVDNFAPGVMERLGLGYSELRKVKPDIVVAALSGFGATGPYSSYVAFAKPCQAFGGLIELTGYADGPPGEPSLAIGDSLNGTHAAFAILAALYYRAKTGEGQFIDSSMSEAVMCGIPDAIMEYTMNKTLRHRMGNRDDIMTPHNVYRCKGDDEWVAIAISSDEEWKSLCKVMGNPDLDRWQNEDELDKVIETWTINQNKHEVMKILQKVGVAAAPVAKADDLANDLHLNQRDYFVECDSPKAPGKWLAGPSWKMSDTPGGIRRRHGPHEGEDNEYVYGELLGMSRDEIERLIAEKVIY